MDSTIAVFCLAITAEIVFVAVATRTLQTRQTSALLAGCGTSHPPTSTSRWPTRVVVVPAVYREWDERIPSWACPSQDDRYSVGPLYQRIDPRAPRYLPNYAYEGGTYLRFVLDHYEELPEWTVFVQADAASELNLGKHFGAVGPHFRSILNDLPLDALEAAGVRYLPVNERYIGGRRVGWNSVDGYNDNVRHCWLRVAGWFGVDPALEDREATVSLYCCNYFAVSRKNVLRHARATWEVAYENLVVNGSCTGAWPDRERGLHEGGNALEHLAHLIWGDDSQAHYAGPAWEHWNAKRQVLETPRPRWNYNKWMLENRGRVPASGEFRLSTGGAFS